MESSAQPDAALAPYRLDGRVVVVTGAGSGIGRASAELMGACGATVVCVDRNAEPADQTQSGINSRGGRASAAVIDVTQRGEVEWVVRTAVEQYGRLDAMCNIAGVTAPGSVLELSDDDVEQSLAINLLAALYGCQAAGRVMVEAGTGSIVNMASGTVDAMAPNLAAYSMPKAAVVQLTRSLAMEIGPAGVRVNAVSPGFIHTALTARHYSNPDGTTDEERREAVSTAQAAVTPLRRTGEPADVAHAIHFLVSDASAFITGQVFRPNGGLAMPW